MPDYDKQTRKRPVTKIIIHCSATNDTQDFSAADIRQWHLKRGWSDIGYHYVIRQNGEIEPGRDLDKDGDIFEEVGAHVRGYNRDSIGICLVGGVDRNNDPVANFTPEQWMTLERAIRFFKAEFPKATVHGHNEFANKACPSFDVQTWLKSVNL